jgi:hypothetical protein
MFCYEKRGGGGGDIIPEAPATVLNSNDYLEILWNLIPQIIPQI